MFGNLGKDEKGWGITTIGNCCVLNPKRPKGISDELMVSFVPMPAVSEDGLIDCSDVKPYAEVKKGFTYFAEGDVLFAKITPCMENGKGAVAQGLSNGIGAGSTEFHVLRSIEGISNPYWLYIITRFDSFRAEARKVMTGTGGQLRVSIGFLENYSISLPPINLQDEFETIVHQSDKSKFTEHFKSQFIELFGQLPEHFKHDTVELGKIADMLSGGTPSSKHPEYYRDKYPFVTTPCLGKNYINESDAVNWLSEAGVQNSSTHIIPAYSVMYGSRVGVGKSSINICEMCTNQDILSFFNIDTSKYDLLFIKKVMDQYFDYVDTQKRGSTIKGVPSDIVKSIRIPKVPIEEQRAFAEFTQQSDKSKYVAFQETKFIENLLNYTYNHYFRRKNYVH